MHAYFLLTRSQQDQSPYILNVMLMFDFFILIKFIDKVGIRRQKGGRWYNDTVRNWGGDWALLRPCQYECVKLWVELFIFISITE